MPQAIKQYVVRNKFLILIVFFSGLLSLVYSFYFKIAPVVDARVYDTIAVNILEGGAYKEDLSKSYEFDTAIIRVGPGYEFFLAGIYYVFGHHYEAVWIMQALLHALSALLLFQICRRLFSCETGEKIGLFAAVLFGLHPDLIEISAMLMSETLYLFFIILSIWVFIYSYQSTESYPGIVLGCIIALTILIRPTVILFIPLILVYYLYHRRYKSLCFFLLTSGAVVAPWIVRNYIHYHQFILTDLAGSVNIWLGNTLQSTGGQFTDSFNPANDYARTHGFFSLKEKAKHELWFFILVHPFIFIKLCLWRAVRFFSLIRPMGFWFYQSGLKQMLFVASSLLAIAALFISGFSGMLLSLKEKKSVFYYLIFFALTTPFILIMTVVQSRYRFQIYPFLAIFGGYLIYKYIWERDRAVKNSLWIAGGFLALLTSVDIVFSFTTVAERIFKFI